MSAASSNFVTAAAASASASASKAAGFQRRIRLKAAEKVVKIGNRRRLTRTEKGAELRGSGEARGAT